MYVSYQKKTEVVVSEQRVVWKIFTLVEGELYSAVRNSKYYLGKKKSVRSFGSFGSINYEDKKRCWDKSFTDKIPDGAVGIANGLHFYTSKKGAIRDMFLDEVVVKCIVPEGTPHIISDDRRRGVSLALVPLMVVYNAAKST